MVKLRAATDADAPAIRAVLVDAFPTRDEADLVDALRADGDVLLEWVAEIDGQVVGAIQYSPLVLERADSEDGKAAALAPVAVMAEHQNAGVGGSLIQATLRALADAPLEAVVVLGHADYYPRFGFSSALARKALIDPFDAGPAFMAMRLSEDGLGGAPARPLYARAFGVGR